LNRERTRGRRYFSASAADDVEQLQRDLRLPGAVVGLGELLEHLARRIRGGLHRHHPRDLLADRGIGEALEEAGLDRQRQELRKEFARRRREIVLDRRFHARLAPRLLFSDPLRRLQRKELKRIGILPRRGFKSHVDHVDAVDLAIGVTPDEIVCDRLDLGELGLVLEMRVRGRYGPAHKPEVADPFFPGHLQFHDMPGLLGRLAGLLPKAKETGGGAKQAGVISPTQSTVTGDYQENTPTGSRIHLQQRVLNLLLGCGEVTNQLG